MEENKYPQEVLCSKDINLPYEPFSIKDERVAEFQHYLQDNYLGVLKEFGFPEGFLPFSVTPSEEILEQPPKLLRRVCKNSKISIRIKPLIAPEESKSPDNEKSTKEAEKKPKGEERLQPSEAREKKKPEESHSDNENLLSGSESHSDKGSESGDENLLSGSESHSDNGSESEPEIASKPKGLSGSLSKSLSPVNDEEDEIIDLGDGSLGGSGSAGSIRSLGGSAGSIRSLGGSGSAGSIRSLGGSGSAGSGRSLGGSAGSAGSAE